MVAWSSPLKKNPCSYICTLEKTVWVIGSQSMQLKGKVINEGLEVICSHLIATERLVYDPPGEHYSKWSPIVHKISEWGKGSAIAVSRARESPGARACSKVYEKMEWNSCRLCNGSWASHWAAVTVERRAEEGSKPVHLHYTWIKGIGENGSLRTVANAHTLLEGRKHKWINITLLIHSFHAFFSIGNVQI